MDRPKNRDHGDYSTNIAMVLAKRAGLALRDLAAKVVEQLRGQAGIEAVEIAGPGFINITLAADSAGAIAHSIVEQGADYGTIDALQAQRSTSSSSLRTPPGRCTRSYPLGGCRGRHGTRAGGGRR